MSSQRNQVPKVQKSKMVFDIKNSKRGKEEEKGASN